MIFLFNAVPDISNNLFPNLSTLIAHLIACVIILYFLIRWAWKPFKKSQKERENYISDLIKKAENAKILAKLNEEKTHGYLNDSKVEAAKILENAKAEVEVYKLEKINEVNSEISLIKKEAKSSIDSEKIKMAEEARKEIIDISFIMAEKIIKKNLSKKDNEDIINDVLKNYEKK